VARFKTVDRNISFSGQLSSQQLRLAIETNIQTILNLRCTNESGFRSNEKKEVEGSGRIDVHIPISPENLSFELVTGILDISTFYRIQF